MKRFILFFVFSLGGLLQAQVDYHIDIAPIFRDYCGGCHNESDYDGDFSIETFRAVMEGGESGETIITPGDPGKSHLAYLMTGKAKRPMPPSKEPQLKPEELELVLRWIKEGAKGPAPDKDLSILASLNVPKIASASRAPAPITAAECAKHGKAAAIARYGKITIGKQVIEVDGKVNAVHFSPDGKWIIAATGVTGLKGIAKVFDIVTGREILSVGEGEHRDILFDAEFSPDGKLIATAGYDRKINIWAVGSGKLLLSIEGHNGAIFDLSFSPDSKLIASASADETGKIWRVSDGERLDTLNQPEGEQFRISFTPDGRYVICAGADKKIRLYRFVSKNRPRINPLLHARFAHEDTISEMSISNDGKWLATASADESVKIWTLPGLKQVKMFGNQPDLVSVLSFENGSNLLAGRMNGDLETYSLEGLSGPAGDEKTYVEEPDFAAVTTGDLNKYTEGKEQVLAIKQPAEISGIIDSATDTDDYRFSARKDEGIIFEINAARSKSMLDSKIEVLNAKGEKVERVVLQAVRDSWFTFRGKDSNTSDDFRVHNWEEMEINEFLYADGEVVKLWHYPRGPDSGFRVYPGFGNRRTYFDTTPLSHPLGGPCYIVEPHAPGSNPNPNGLPVYTLYWENDDDGLRMNGKDSRLTFIAPEDGDYIIRVSDVRGFGGEKYHYKLMVRPPKPGFNVTHNGAKLKVSPGSGREIEFKATRIDGFEDDIKVEVRNLPKGFYASPTTIQARQLRAYMAIHSAMDAEAPSAEAIKKIQVVASAMVNGNKVEKTLAGLPEFGLTKAPNLRVDIYPDGHDSKTTRIGEDGILEMTIRPGETISALVKADRINLKGRITFGKDESGRNMPHGVFVDNIGLSGLMIPDAQTVQRFWITCADWVPEMERMFHLVAAQDGKQATRPVRLRVVR